MVDEAQQRAARFHMTIRDPKKDTQPKFEELELAGRLPFAQEHADVLRALCKEQGKELVRLSEKFLKVSDTCVFLNGTKKYVDEQQTMIVGTCRGNLKKLIDDTWTTVDQVLAESLKAEIEWIREYIGEYMDGEHVSDNNENHPASDATTEERCRTHDAGRTSYDQEDRESVDSKTIHSGPRTCCAIESDARGYPYR